MGAGCKLPINGGASRLTSETILSDTSFAANPPDVPGNDKKSVHSSLEGRKVAADL